MQVILLEKNKKLGDIGNIVNVKNGYARNFLIPNKKAIQATTENREVFKQKEKIIRQEVEQKNAHAEKISSKLAGKWIYILKQAGKDGKLYGSVTTLDIIKAIKDQIKQEIEKNSIQLLTPIKYMSSHSISVNIFADVYVTINILISRTKEEAEIELKNITAGKPAKKAESSKIEKEEVVSKTSNKTKTKKTTPKAKNIQSTKKDIKKTQATDTDTKETQTDKDQKTSE